MAMRRELEEEVKLKSPGAMRLMGLINDDSTPVGQVHLGVVHLFELQRPHVTPREDGLTDCEFVPIAGLRDHWDDFETWSQICIEAFLRAR
jgi:predicted NUDIX family phosphoesterase